MTGARQFTLRSGTAAPTAPFCLAFAFRKGEVPQGTGVVGNIADLQVTAKNRWPDESLKLAIVAGRAALSANTPLVVSLSTGSASSGTALALADLQATGITATVGCGSLGTANFAAAEWNAPSMTWVTGPQMSSWIYRKPVGTDPHLVAWLEVRLYAGGAVEILPWIENGYLKVAGACSKSATFTFAINGAQRFGRTIDLPAHCRTPLIDGSEVSYWLGVNPGVVVKHDTDYLQATGVVPSYRASVSPAAPAVVGLPTRYAPLQQGSFPGAMGTAGYHPSIGLLPEWDVLYLTSSADAPYKAVQFNAYSAGRYGLHFRDEATNRPIRFSQWPNLCMSDGNGVTGIGGSVTGEETTSSTGPAFPATWASSHHPSVGFMAYLLTGRWYFMEEVQFVATALYLKQHSGYRQGSAGVLLSNSGSNTERGMAWGIRTLFQAACITPDDDVLANDFLSSLRANVGYLHARYVARPHNPYGWITPYADYTGGDGVYMGAAWMQDFITAAFGYGLAMDLRIPSGDASKLAQFFAWKAKSIVGRFGGTGADEYLYRDAATYTIAIAPTDSPDFENGTGPWFPNWGSLYAATYRTSPGPHIEGDLRGAYFPGATAYWGNLMPALTYAVQHNVPGASAAYARLTSASNWHLFEEEVNGSPVWGTKPGAVQR